MFGTSDKLTVSFHFVPRFYSGYYNLPLGTTENSVEPIKFQNFEWLHTSYMKPFNNVACLLRDHIPECPVLLEKCTRPYFRGLSNR